MLGEEVACATVSPLYITVRHTYCRTYKSSVIRHSGSCTPTSGISIMEFVTS